MTWNQLKKRIEKLSKEQLKQTVFYEDNYNNILSVELYINDSQNKQDDIADENIIKSEMPYLGQV